VIVLAKMPESNDFQIPKWNFKNTNAPSFEESKLLWKATLAQNGFMWEHMIMVWT